jgi:hypothetical protein
LVSLWLCCFLYSALFYFIGDLGIPHLSQHLPSLQTTIRIGYPVLASLLSASTRKKMASS